MRQSSLELQLMIKQSSNNVRHLFNNLRNVHVFSLPKICMTGRNRHTIDVNICFPAVLTSHLEHVGTYLIQLFNSTHFPLMKKSDDMTLEDFVCFIWK